MANKEVKVPEVQLTKMTVVVENREDSSFLMQKMSDDTKKELEEKYEKGNFKGQQEKKKAKEEILEGHIHRTEDDEVGFPAAGFQKALINMAKTKQLDGVSGKLVSGAVQVMGDIIPMKYEEMKVSELWGTRSGRTGAPRLIVRPEFENWSFEIPVAFNSKMISAEQVLNLFNLAGFHIGVGSYRKANGGSYGMFKVKETKNKKDE